MSQENSSRPTDDKQIMSADLFEKLDEGLRKVFDEHVKKGAKPGNYNSHATHGLTAAQTATALMQLHRDFTPG